MTTTSYRRAVVRADMGTAVHLAKDVPGALVRTKCGIEFSSTLDVSAAKLRALELCGGCFPRKGVSADVRPAVRATFVRGRRSTGFMPRSRVR